MSVYFGTRLTTGDIVDIVEKKSTTYTKLELLYTEYYQDKEIAVFGRRLGDIPQIFLVTDVGEQNQDVKSFVYDPDTEEIFLDISVRSIRRIDSKDPINSKSELADKCKNAVTKFKNYSSE